MIVGLEQIQMEKCHGTTKEREDAEECARLRGKIYNKKFMTTTGACDIYVVYGTIANVVQTVDMLPWEKFDLFMKLTDILRQMALTVSQSNCPGCKAQDQSSQGFIVMDDQDEVMESLSDGKEDDDIDDDHGDDDNVDIIESRRPQQETVNENVDRDQENDDEDDNDVDESHRTDQQTDDDIEDETKDDETALNELLVDQYFERICKTGRKTKKKGTGRSRRNQRQENQNGKPECLWKNYHPCLDELKKDKYHGLSFYDDHEDLDDTILDRTRDQQISNKRRRERS